MFSEVVDQVCETIGRIDLASRRTAERYVNLTVAEIVAEYLFWRDRIEDQIDISNVSANSYIWTHPATLRLILDVKYEGGSTAFPQWIEPGKSSQNFDYFYYGASGYYVFAGIEHFTTIDLVYYVRAKRLSYYVSGLRPAVWNEDGEFWTYLLNGTYVTSLNSPTDEEIARNIVSHWPLTFYRDLVAEGTLAKFYKSIESPQARSTFALFSSLKAVMLGSESFENVARPV